MSHQLAADRLSAFRGRMDIFVNAVKFAASGGNRAGPHLHSKVLGIRDRLHRAGRARNSARVRGEGEIDGAALVALAMDRLTPALLRASIIGVPVTVEVPDERTAEVFRAALAKTRSRRPTDRLVDVVVKAP